MDEDLKSEIARLQERTEHIITKIDDHKGTTNKIWDKLDKLPCGAMKEKVKGMGIRVNWLYFAFTIVILGGIVLGVWMRNGMAK